MSVLTPDLPLVDIERSFEDSSIPKLRFIAMLYGHKLFGPRPHVTSKLSWNVRSIEVIANLMTEGSLFATYVYAEYEQLVELVASASSKVWESSTMGSLTVYGPHNPNSDGNATEQTTVKVGTGNASVHLLSQDFLTSFGPKPQREVAFNGGRRFHRMWVDAFKDIGLIWIKDQREINQHTLVPMLAKRGFTSLMVEELFVVRDVHPAMRYLHVPDVQRFVVRSH